jgi:hypothetical protein
MHGKYIDVVSAQMLVVPALRADPVVLDLLVLVHLGVAVGALHVGLSE